MTSVFGFSTEGSSGGDFTPVVKYDSRAGRMFRVDREQVNGQWTNEPLDITRQFKAVVDLENLETGWIDFNTGGAPAFAMARIGEPLPGKPTPNAKNGVRAMVKLAKDCGGERPIREMASTAKAFLQGMEELYLAYQKEAPANPGKLPVVVLEDSLPIKSGSGEKSSTNYRPVFKITGWTARGDLVWTPKNEGATPAPAASAGAPDTGSTRVDPPKAKSAPAKSEEDEFADFG